MVQALKMYVVESKEGLNVGIFYYPRLGGCNPEASKGKLTRTSGASKQGIDTLTWFCLSISGVEHSHRHDVLLFLTRFYDRERIT